MRLIITLVFCLFAGSFRLALAQATVTPVSYNSPGAAYTQNFDGLPNSGSFSLTGKGPFNLGAPPINGMGLTGWQLMMVSGSNNNAAFAAGAGTSTGNGVYSFGGTGSSERALGSLASGSGVYAFGVLLTNNTGGILNRFTVSFTAEQWRKGGSTNKNTWAFRYKTGILTNMDPPALLADSGLNFGSVITTASAAGLNGNLPDNQKTISYTVTSLNWNPGEQLLLRWDDADETGSDDACAIDNFSFSASVFSTAPSVLNNPATGIGTNTAILNGSVHDHYANTTVTFEYDTLNTWTHPQTIHSTPDSIIAGSGATPVTATLSGLLPGTVYYSRIKASNHNGTIVSAIQNFTTAISLPAVISSNPVSVTTHSALLGGTVGSAGGSVVTERGIVWSLNPGPVLLNNKIAMGSGTGDFAQQVNDLPSGTTLYVRAYAINAGGTAYGNELLFTTLNTVVSLTTVTAGLTNASSVGFRLQTEQALNGLSPSNFIVQTTGITDAAIGSISVTGNIYIINVNTGTGDGTVGLALAANNNLSSALDNLPFSSTGMYTIDRTAPVIKALFLPDRPMKIGDSIEVIISVIPDTGILQMGSGNINGIAITGFTKRNDSIYQAEIIIPNGGTDIPAAADIPVSVSLTDSAGNTGLYQTPVIQPSDMIDANRPQILSVINPPDAVYKTGDALDYIFRFTENILLTATANAASLSVTIGSKTRTAVYFTGSGTDSIVFRYVIQSGDLDKNGVKPASSILLNSSVITDRAGNTALLTFSNHASVKGVLVDAVAATVISVSVPAAAVYRTGNLLDFVVKYSKKVWIADSADGPSLQVNIGSKTRKVSYTSGSGSNAFLFRYTIMPDDTDKDGIKLSPSIILNTSFLRDEAGNNASLSLNNIGGMSGIRINPLTAAINGIILPGNSVYKTGDTLEFMISYNEKIFVATGNGIPYLKFTAGKTTRQAFYKNGSGGNLLLFTYAVQAGDEDTDGIKINTVITLNNGFITDTLNNPAPVTFVIPENTGGILLDGVPPAANSITGPAGKVYKTGDTLLFNLGFSEKILVAVQRDTPLIQITTGPVVQNIPYFSGSGSDHLLFRYMVKEGDLDKNGIKAGSMILMNNCITDIAGNTALPSIKNAGVLQGVYIDGIAPSFVNNKTDTILICENGAPVSVNHSFTVGDTETNEQLNWKIISPPYLGSLASTSLAANSNGKTIMPTGFIYTPFKDISGSDSLLMEVTDSMYTIKKKLLIEIQPALKNNVIGPSQILCTNQIPSTISGTKPLGGNGSYRYQWEISSVDSTHFVNAPGSDYLPEYISAQLNSNSWFRRILSSGACTDTSSAVKITVLKNGLWTGNQDNNWNNPNNWCNAQVPDKTTDVIIYPNTAHNPLIEDSAHCNRLTLIDKSSLAITGVLEISENIINASGAVDLSNGTVTFTGNAQQILSGNSLTHHQLKNLIINNTTNTHVQDSLIITGTILLNSGTLVTHDRLYLQNLAAIGASAAGTSVKGKIFMEHRIRGGRRCFWLLGHPFADDMGLQTLKDSMDITGDGGQINGFTNTATNQPSAFRHNPFDGNDSSGVDAGWIPFTHTNGLNDNAWKKNTGIRILMRGRPGQGLDGTPAGNGKPGTYLPEQVMIKISGQVNTGEQEIVVRKDKYAGYNVIANPYPSPVNLSRVTYGSSIGMHYWIWDPGQGTKGGYSSIPFKTKYILPPFGALIVKANNNTNNTILFTENSKTTEPVSENLPVIDIDDTYHLELRLETDSIFRDRILLLSVDSAKTGFDKNDAEKFDNPDINFYSLSEEQKKLSTDARPLDNKSVIKLGLQTNEPGSFRIRIAKANLPASANLMLHDRYLNKWMPLEKDSMYSFTTSTDTFSQGNQRFVITNPEKEKDTMVSAASIFLSITPVPAKDRVMVKFSATESGNTSIRLLTLSGMPVKNISLGIQKEGQAVVQVGGLLRGIYLLELTCGSQVSTKKLIKD